MKKLLAMMAVGLILVSTAMDADAARRLGGGSSFGRPAPTLRQAAPQPAAPQMGQQAQRNPGAQAQKPATGAAAANAAKPSPWRGILMGAAAALGITALMSALGLGEGFAQIIMVALLAMVLFFVFRLVAGKLMAGKARPAGAASYGNASSGNTHFESTPAPEQSRPATQAATPASMMGGQAATGSVMDMFSRGQSATSDAAGPAIPEGFDKAGFEAVAKENFIKLQKAWDTGNVVEISDFTTNDLFIAITHQLRERGAQAQTSEVINLTSELLGVMTEGNEHVAVVEFNGAMKISGEFEEVHERWILVRATDDSTGWLLAGIEQVQDNK
ncbi:MAG: TIM44-like domain-containing protein [Sutterellaceae bacterium]|nr:TIM44-like domain-containing protein [Sutterellaceae bacterium]